MLNRRHFLQSAALAPAGLLLPRVGRASSPSSCSLWPEYQRYGLPAQAQQGPHCWAYSIIGCLELELARAGRGAVSLSGPYLAWAAAIADRDAIDRSGSNFARAARGLERFGICEEQRVPKLNLDAPEKTLVSDETVQGALKRGRDVRIDWLRFWRTPPGLTAAEMDVVKARLAAGHPVAVGMRWPKELTVADRELCLLGTCRSLDETFDGHCITLVGYEDDAKREGGGTFLIRNTWGKDWMQQGYARMSYAHLQRYANDAISFAVAPDAPDRLRPNATAPTNQTRAIVVPVRAADCKPDPGVRLSDDSIGSFGQGIWQGDDQLFCRSDADGKGFTLRVTIARTGDYDVSLAGTRAPDYGTWKARIDGRALGLPCDFSWPGVAPTGEWVLGRVKLAAGTHLLRFERAGKSAASMGYLFGLDWVRFQPA